MAHPATALGRSVIFRENATQERSTLTIKKVSAIAMATLTSVLSLYFMPIEGGLITSISMAVLLAYIFRGQNSTQNQGFIQSLKNMASRFIESRRNAPAITARPQRAILVSETGGPPIQDRRPRVIPRTDARRNSPAIAARPQRTTLVRGAGGSATPDRRPRVIPRTDARRNFPARPQRTTLVRETGGSGIQERRPRVIPRT